MDDLMLERFVERSAAATTYPTTPSLRAGVLAAISVGKPTTAAAGWRPRLVLAALGIVTLVSGITLALPTSRSAIADLFGVEGTKIERLPTPAAGITATPLPAASDPSLIATPVSLDEAERRTGFRPALPGSGPEPSSVYVKTYIEGGSVVILRYRDFDIWEMRPRDISLGKGVPEGVVVRDMAVGGRPAYWIEGGPHVAYLLGVDTTGNASELPGSERTVARDTLIWRTDFALYRLETTLPLVDALRVAESLP